MKCIHCGTKARRRDLRRGRCRSCGRAFAFDPTRDPHPVSDADFHEALKMVSGNGRTFFTARQLWYALHRQRTRPPAWAELEGWFGALAGLGTFVLGPLGVVPLGALPMAGIGLVVAIGAVALVNAAGPDRARKRQKEPPEIPFDAFSRHLARWAEVRGPLERLVPDPAPDAAPREVPADPAALDFDRVLVTQHADVAAMLVANGFHVENRCAVLSLDGYPFGVAEAAREALRRSPRLTVFAVHDASTEGALLPAALRDPAWFPDPAVLIVDVGLAASSWMNLPVLRDGPAKLPANHPKGVAGWSLAPDPGSRVELAAVAPEHLTWMLQRAFENAGLPGQHAHDEAVRLAAPAGGVISSSLLPIPSLAGMACIHCGHRSRRKERLTGRCPKCGHAMAFNPASDPLKVTDALFQSAVRSVSDDGRVRFTRRQLHYELDRKRRPRRRILGRAATWLNGPARERAPAGLLSPGIYFELQFLPLLKRWTAAHGEPPGLLPPPAADAPAREVPPDVAAFSFDRAVVTDRAETADVLVANRFHFEHGCAVLSADGYPFGIAETVKTMLRRNPRLTVFAVHDASLEGCALPALLRGPEWFPDPGVRVVDVGLRPETARRLGFPSVYGRPGRLGPEALAGISAADWAWLEAGNQAELAVLRPTALMRLLQRAFAAAGPPDNPAYAAAGAAAGYVWLGDLPSRGGGDTAATDGFG
jgi:hypothetical protein